MIEDSPSRARQRAIQTRCVHPTGAFVEFPPGAIEQSIASRFEEQARRYGDRLAVKTPDRQLAYAELDRAASVRLLQESDLVIITALALVNGTLPELMRLAKVHDVTTMIWAVTARNFGPYYVEHGVDSVISDPAPFLLVPGLATIRIWRHAG